ncbi:MAG: hypothetical protein L6420_09720 [Elusimicrobia bacterium]|nr:hypothetical protein [Elusimicrobiota bacterium]
MEDPNIDKQLDEMWKRITGTNYVPEYGHLPKDVRESNVETMKFLKDNFSKAQIEWQSLLETKEHNIVDLTAQLSEMKAHLGELRQHYQVAREKLIAEELNVALKLDETQKILKSQKHNHHKEIALLKEVLERSRTEIENLQIRADKLIGERDESRKKSREYKEDSMNLKDSVMSLENKIQESKRAVEETLSELFAERKAKSLAEKKASEMDVKNNELQADIASLRSNWDAERKQWRELWERERSVWETHRQEFAVWEQRLRTERQAWTDKIKKEEQKDIDYATGLSKVLKESTQWSEKVTQILKLYALKGVELPKVFVPIGQKSMHKPAGAFKKVFAIALGGLIMLGGLGFWVYDYRSKAHLKLLSQYTLNLKNPTAVSISKEGIWLSDWQNGISLRDKKDFALLREINGSNKEPFRPSAMEVKGDYIWVLDMAQLRFVKKETKQGLVMQSVKTPGPAPQSVSFDGFNLWSFDAATGLVYRYSLDPEQGIEASFEINGIKNIASMQWRGAILWVLGSDSYLRRYKFEYNAFKEISSQKLENKPISFSLMDDSVWLIEKNKNQNGYELKKYKLKIFGSRTS